MEKSRFALLRQAVAASSMATMRGKVHTEAARALGCKPYPVATKVVIHKAQDDEGEVLESYVGTLQALSAGVVLFCYQETDCLFVEKSASGEYLLSSLSDELYSWNGRLGVEADGGATLYLDRDRDTYCYYHLPQPDYSEVAAWLDRFLAQQGKGCA